LKNPARGIMAEIAKEEAVTRQSIWQSITIHKNPRICERFNQKYKKRMSEIRKAKATLQKAIETIDEQTSAA